MNPKTKRLLDDDRDLALDMLALTLEALVKWHESRSEGFRKRANKHLFAGARKVLDTWGRLKR
jgi:hypothetical protein